MENRLSEQKDFGEKNMKVSQSSVSNTKESINKGHPFLTAYIGFLALCALFGFTAGLIFAIPGYLFSDTINIGEYYFKAVWSIFALLLIFGYYGFKFVINKHVLPNTKE